MLNAAQELIFERYKQPHYAGPLDHADLEAEGANPTCGDELKLELQVSEGIITKIAHTTRACAVCTASADLLCEQMTGQPLSLSTELTPATVTGWLGIPLSPLRLKCALLPLETLRQAAGIIRTTDIGQD